MQIHVNLYENQHIPSVSWQVILCLRCSDCVRLSGRLEVSDTINAPVRYGEGRRCWDRSWRVTGAVSLLPFAHSPLNSVSSPWERQARGVENRRGAARTLECLVITALPAAIPPPREQECSGVRLLQDPFRSALRKCLGPSIHISPLFQTLFQDSAPLVVDTIPHTHIKKCEFILRLSSRIAYF